MLTALLFALLPSAALPHQDAHVGDVQVGAKPVADAHAGHGKLDWFQGTYAELLAEAKKTNKPIFMDYWTTWCGWCKKLDSDTFSDAGVVEQMKSVLCYSVDAEQSDPKAEMDGARLAQRYGVRGYPYLVFADPSGELCDRISGYLPPADFLRETRRILSGENTLSELRARVQLEPANLFQRGDYMQRLLQYNDPEGARREGAEIRARVERGEGFDPTQPYERWRVADLLRRAGDEAGANAQLDAVRQFGAPGVQWLARRAAFDTAVGQVNRGFQTEKKLDASPIVTFLAEEKLPELVYEAWTARRNLELFTANERRKEQKLDEASRARTAARTAAREAWKACPERFKGDAARDFVMTWLPDAAQLAADEKTMLVEVARWAVLQFPKDAARHDVLGQALLAQGHADEAVTAFEKALELAPGRLNTRSRLAEARAALEKK
ncbi:MAG: thioredoxin fold domain-containing protein [Planctomycetes bacterium]|nr:thioredoxin fold domain-containing protein [Planctomycetota bacterium]